jgi:hypothetical protein
MIGEDEQKWAGQQLLQLEYAVIFSKVIKTTLMSKSSVWPCCTHTMP